MVAASVVTKVILMVIVLVIRCRIDCMHPVYSQVLMLLAVHQKMLIPEPFLLAM